MKQVEIYDPALCCDSGACGPSPDEALAAFASGLEKLKAAGVSVTRHNLAQEPLAFAQNAAVKDALATQGDSALPLIFIDREIAFRGAYPSYPQLAEALGLPQDDASCCGPDDDCCSDAGHKAPLAFRKVEAPQAPGASCCDPSTGCC